MSQPSLKPWSRARRCSARKGRVAGDHAVLVAIKPIMPSAFAIGCTRMALERSYRHAKHVGNVVRDGPSATIGNTIAVAM